MMGEGEERCCGRFVDIVDGIICLGAELTSAILLFLLYCVIIDMRKLDRSRLYVLAMLESFIE
jgi:hypothetical protein